MDCSPPGSPVHGIFQARVLEWVTNALSHVYVCVCTYIYIYTHDQLLNHVQLFVTPWMTSPGSAVHGIFQARILDQVAISYSRESSWPSDLTWVSCTDQRILTTEPLRKPFVLTSAVLTQACSGDWVVLWAPWWTDYFFSPCKIVLALLQWGSTGHDRDWNREKFCLGHHSRLIWEIPPRIEPKHSSLLCI